MHYLYNILALITRPPDGVLLAPLALAARRLRRLASLRELLPVVRTEFHNRSPDVASTVLRTWFEHRSPGVAFRVFRTSVSPARIHE